MKTFNINQIIFRNDDIISMTITTEGRGCGSLGWSCQSNLSQGVEI